MTFKRLLPILTILLLAASSRIVNASGWPLWTDEGWSVWAASDPHIETIWQRVSSDRHPPAFFLSLSAWESVAGDSRLALRYLSIVGGLLTVALAYRLGADWFGRRAGLYGALLLAVLDIAVYHSQEVRHYGWLALSVSLMSLFFLRYLRQPRRLLLVAYALSIAFMLYTLYFGVFVVAVHAFAGLILWGGPQVSRRAKVGLIAAWIAAAVLYIPWIPPLVSQWRLLSGGVPPYPTTLDGITKALALMFSDAQVVILFFYGIGALAILWRRGKDWPARLAILLSGLGILITMFAINLRVGLITERTLSFLAPMFMIVCGYGLSLLRPAYANWFAAGLTAYFLVSNPVIAPRLDSDKVASTLAAGYAPGDLIVLETGWDDNALRYEILRQLGPQVGPEIISTLPWDNDYAPRQPVIPQIEVSLRAHRRTWLVNWLVYSQVQHYLGGGGTGYRTIETHEVPVGPQYLSRFPDPVVRVILYEKPPTEDCLCTSYHFGDTLLLRDAVYSETVRRGDVAHVDLWWSALKAPPEDYTVVAFLLDTHDRLKVRDDRPPGQTSRWQPGEAHVGRHALAIPADLPPGTYQLAVKAYLTDRNWLPVNGSEYVVIGAIRVTDALP